jgi:V8-like Glu-specific endopeptidase
MMYKYVIMKKLINSYGSIRIIFVIVFLFVNESVLTQTWRQYHIPSGVITNINFSYTSSGNSANTLGFPGLLPCNFTSDTSRLFFPIDIINDPSAYPWRTTVKIGGATGILIDPYHVLTAGHIISFSPSFGTTKIIPAYAQGDSPYGYSNPVCVYLLSDYSSTGPKDLGIIKLDRPLGAIAGWNGYGYNNSDAFFTSSNIFFNPNYPCTGLYNGEYLYNWKGVFNSAYVEYVISSRTGISGMSGSCAFTKVNGENVVFGLVVATGIKFNRITSQKYDAINAVINYNLPSVPDLVPFYLKSYPSTIKSGSLIDSVSFGILNYSNLTLTNRSITAKLYISSDSIITESDSLLAENVYNLNFVSKECKSITLNNISTLNKPAGNYWLGIIISGDENPNNNVTGWRDCAKILINNTDNIYIKGRLVSTQSGNGINGVSISGFPANVISDYNGEYRCVVPLGWSGIISLSKPGYLIAPATYSFQNLISDTLVDFSVTKKIYTVSGVVKSFISEKKIYGVKMCGLKGEPVSDTAGIFTSDLYHGWSGRVVCSKSGYIINPYYFDVSYISSNLNQEISAGLTVSGYVYNEVGSPIQNALITGFPSGNIISGNGGYYSAYLDSGWSGTVTPYFGSYIFNPVIRTYNSISYNYEYQDFQKTVNQYISLRLKLYLGGASVTGSDSMTTHLSSRELIPQTTPDSFSSKNSPFIYKKQPADSVSKVFLANHPEIVDWILIELRTSNNITLDTMPAFLCSDGRVMNLLGDSAIYFRYGVQQGNYYIVIRHRNHIAVMSATTVNITSSTAVYDFTTGTDKYYGNTADYLGNGIYGLFSGDANRDGRINSSDFTIYYSDNVNAMRGYRNTDFTLDGYITGSDFNKYAPNNKNKVSSKIF